MLEYARRGLPVGSHAVREAIKRYQPELDDSPAWVIPCRSLSLSAYRLVGQVGNVMLARGENTAVRTERHRKDLAGVPGQRR
jgi:hypothetical protein